MSMFGNRNAVATQSAVPAKSGPDLMLDFAMKKLGMADIIDQMQKMVASGVFQKFMTFAERASEYQAQLDRIEQRQIRIEELFARQYGNPDRTATDSAVVSDGTEGQSSGSPNGIGLRPRDEVD